MAAVSGATVQTELATELLAAGVPVVVCTPDSRWSPGSARSDVLPPADWSVTTAAECDLSRYRPGVDTLAMVGGHGVDVVDVDSKVAGTVDNLPPFRSFGQVRTPSGGAHYYVRSTGIGKLSPLTTSAGHVGDYVGGTPQSGGRLLAYLPGSSRPRYPGAGYEVVVPLDLAALLEHDPDDDLVSALLACGGTRNGMPGKPAARWAEVRTFLAGHSELPESPCHYGRTAVAGLIANADAVVPGDPKRGRHAWAVASATRAVELVRAGCASAADLDDLERTLHRVKPEGGTDWGGCVAWGLTNADGTSACRVHNPASTVIGGGGRPERARYDALVAHLRTWQDGDDFDHVAFACGVAVSAGDNIGDPLWGMVVGAPSSGKTETIRALDDVTDDRVDELTAAALLSWGRTKVPKPTGVLTRVPDPALLTVGDFSTVLATSDRGGRDQLFALLRRVYDGAVTRDLGNAPGPLRWEGRLTVLAAVTPAIDDYTTHTDALGPRWLYLRMPDIPRAARRAAASRHAGDLTERRRQARQLALEAVRRARAVLGSTGLDGDTLRTIGDAAIVVAAARGSVPRDGYGRRDVIAMPTVEEPHRLVGQLQMLTRSLLALGLTVSEAEHLTVRAALDTIPRSRLAVLKVLATGEVLTVGGLAERAGLNRKVARFAVEDLRETQLTCCPVEDTSDVDDVADLGNVKRDWQLTEYLGEIAVEVLAGQRERRPVDQADTKMVDHPPNPPSTEADSPSETTGHGGAPHVSYRLYPHARLDTDDRCPSCSTPLAASPDGGCDAPDLHHQGRLSA